MLLLVRSVRQLLASHRGFGAGTAEGSPSADILRVLGIIELFIKARLCLEVLLLESYFIFYIKII